MVRRRTGGRAAHNWPLLTGVAAAVAVAVAAFLAQRRLFASAAPTRAPARTHEAVPAHPREGREAPMAHKRTARKAGFNWPLLLGVLTTIWLIWLWWWAATQGGPG
ncbi:hypothetical protein AB0L06_05605 [Spirillospora sp. NPDC052269]